MDVKKRKLLLITYGGYTHASSRIRALNHFNRLKHRFDIDWIPERPEISRDGWSSKLIFAVVKRGLLLKRFFALLFFHYDLVFVQVSFLNALELKIIQFKKMKLIYDFDDAVYERSKSDFQKMIVSSNAIIVSVVSLKDYLGDFNTPIYLLPSPVDVENILIQNRQEKSEVFRIAWIGSETTAIYLEEIRKPFAKLSQVINFELLVVGANFESTDFKVRQVNWSPDNELYVLAISDCGIMPLSINAWSPMKGGYKLYLYMAAGLPVVASPIGVNSEIVESGINGFLASNDEEWITHLEKLANDKQLAKTLGNNGRLKCEQRYSYNVCTKDFLKILDSI